MRGRDKLLEVVEGQPLLRRQAAMAAEVGPVFVALPEHGADRLFVLDGLPVTPLALPEAAEGQSGTLRAGVAALPPCPAFFVLLADLPEIGAADLRALLEARQDHPDCTIWRGATPEGKPGHPILFDAALRLLPDDGGAPLVREEAARTHLHRYADDRARLDLDTPEDWADWRARREGGR